MIYQIQFELDMNCDFSSNNNIWAWFYEFSWLPFSWVVFIMTD